MNAPIKIVKPRKRLTNIKFDFQDIEKVKFEYKPKLSKGWRIKFMGEFISFKNGKQMWKRLGDARSAFTLEFSYSQIMRDIQAKYEPLNTTKDYHFDDKISNDFLAELEAQKIFEFIEV